MIVYSFVAEIETSVKSSTYDRVDEELAVRDISQCRNDQALRAKGDALELSDELMRAPNSFCPQIISHYFQHR